MRKIIIAFAAGQGLQLALLGVALHMTYANDTMMFCIIGGLITTVILGVGVILDRIELAVKETNIKVSTDKVEKILEPPKSGSNAERHPKHVKLTIEGKPSSLMEAALAEVQDG